MDQYIAASDLSVTPSAETPRDLLNPEPLMESGRGWMRWVGPAFSIALLAAAAVWFLRRNHDLSRVVKLVPDSPWFWLVFAVGYLVGPVTDWIIFRRLWTIPFSGFVALLRKQVTNELLPSYSGEVYFYAWARKHGEITGAPFGAIKDVAILSALTGNIFTLAMLALAYPKFGPMFGGAEANSFALAIGFVTASSLAMMMFRTRLFSLPSEELWFIAAMVSSRVVISTFVLALLWHLKLPLVALDWWLVLCTVKVLLSRLPFVPNQAVLFASVSSWLIAQSHVTPKNIEDVIWMVTFATTIVHVVLGTVFGIGDLVRTGVKRNA